MVIITPAIEMSKEEFAEYCYSQGAMPEWAYYQLNGKSAQENYSRIKMHKSPAFFDEVTLKKDLEKAVEPLLNQVLDELTNKLSQ